MSWNIFRRKSYRRKKDKYRSETEHTILRAKERFNVELNKDDIQHLVHKVKTGDGEFIRDLSNTRSAWALELIKGAINKYVVVIYDKKRHNIVTILEDRNDLILH